MSVARSDPNRMTFLEHLDEFRSRLFKMALALAIGVAVGWFLHPWILDLLMEPVQTQLPEGVKPVYTVLTEAFMLAVKVSFFAGLMLAFPFVIMQLWLFISPGLYRRERRYALPFIFFGSVFFFLGCWFGYGIVFPYAARFLINFAGEDFTPMLTISKIFGFEMRLILSMGAIFQLPVLIYLLARLGLVTAGFLWRNFKYAVLIIFVVAAVLTPTPDAVTMTLVAGPMIGLYLLGILVALVFGRSRDAEDEEAEEEDAEDEEAVGKNR